MAKETLAFPDITLMAEFLIKHPMANVEANSHSVTLTAPFCEDDIITACAEYKAEILKPYTR